MEIKNTKGIYVGLKVLEPAKTLIKNFIKENNIPSTEKLVDKLHTTLIYSRTYENIKVDPDIVYVANFDKYEIFPTQDKKHALVAILDCDEIKNRHNYLMNTYPTLTYDYDKFKTHVTLSYDVGADFSIENLEPLYFPVHLGKEYSEDLILGWQNK